MFASTELARRIELAAATTLAAQAESLGGFAASIGEGTAIFAGAASPLTKALAIGFEEAFEVEALAPAEQSFAEHGAPLTIELSTLTRTGVSEALGRRGYVTVGFEDVMGLALDEVRASAPHGAELTIRTSPHDEIATFVDVSVTGFSHPDIEGVASHESFPSDMLRNLMTQIAPHYDRWIGTVATTPAAAASMKIADGIAMLSGSATLPAFRRRGLQTALYEARLDAARKAGAELATVTVSPGSRSKQNAEKRGFKLLYTRAIMVRGG